MSAVPIAECVFLLFLGGHVAHSLAANAGGKPKAGGPSAFTAFVMLVEPFAVVCLSGLRRQKPPLTVVAFLQTGLFILGCYFGYRCGVFSRELVSPFYIALGLVVGHLVFGVSLLLTHQCLRDAAIHFLDVGAIWRYAADTPRVLLQFTAVGVAEEIIYRVGAQPVLIRWMGDPLAGILAVAVVFAMVHEHFFRNPAGQSLEFLGFAILLGALYYWTGSLILVIVIHAVRNIEIAFLEHVVRVDELGGEKENAREADFLGGDALLVLLVLPVREITVACLEYCRDRLAAGQPPIHRRAEGV